MRLAPAAPNRGEWPESDSLSPDRNRLGLEDLP